MKSKIFLSCLLAATALVSTSCSGYLDEDPKGQATPNGFFNTTAKLQSGVYALYAQVEQTQSWTNPLYPMWQGDDMTANPGSNKQAVAELDGFSSTNNNKGTKDAWRLNYAVIKAANLLIEQKAYNEGNTAIPEEEMNIAQGNAHFWRAYAYFYLVRIFGPLPLITTSDLVENVKLSSEEEIYTQIVQDLKDAVSKLPTEYTDSPRHINGVDNYVTKQAAQSTLAAVYMAMAGYPLNKGTEYYKLAADVAKEVIDNNGTYGFFLEPEWKDVYSMGSNYSKAVVLGIANSPNNGSWSYDSELSSCCRFESLGDGGWGDVWGEIKFWKNYPDGPRKRAVYAPKITYQKGTVITDSCDWWALNPDGSHKVSEYHPMFCVFTVNCDAAGNQLEQAYDYRLPNYMGMTNGARGRCIRYSEVLLWYAESAARSGGDLAAAKNCLKQVHNRACDEKDVFVYMDGTRVNIDDMNAEQLAQAAMEEHGWEVAGNWIATVTRRDDEFRMDQLKKNFDYRVQNAPIVVHVDADGKQYTAQEGVAVTKTTWDGLNTIYLPYPDDEVLKNPNLHR